ncbi:RNA polymerase sigma-70 factor (ECF subfamily) [Wenyingzhuangia heitensis]|uniref:RNA polymerase sigma-70 factor (ECF subfamily) n=1 Tax=Wenyingzhuangia heitensis TaxID=1487859 RepID=A0ABX0U9P0_9FLAO|nr:RNA polymerase sigma-70 factor [Wenyingzhuangia heitensis]NIJ43861.1 RNA polymerase sigma-70 factor (ECF subfamily) [Wenyingzhuangia heitensis]
MLKKPSVCEAKIYESLYKKYSKSLYSFMYFKCGDKDRAEDLVQEAFIKLWNNCAKVIYNKAKSYLYTIANNQFLNEVAHFKVKLKYQQNANGEDANIETPDFVLEEKEFMNKLEKAIDNLTPGEREVFLLNRIEDAKYREIAEMLNISVKAVEKRMHGALVKLRQTIGKDI